jgi:hypothetical protein
MLLLHLLCMVNQTKLTKEKGNIIRGAKTSSNGNEQQTKAQANVSIKVKLTNTNKHDSCSIIAESND